MILVEAMRLRNWAIGWAGVLLAIAVTVTLTVQHAAVDINGSRLSGIGISLVSLATLPMFLSMIFEILNPFRDTTTADACDRHACHEFTHELGVMFEFEDFLEIF